MGSMFKALGLLPDDSVKEAAASDLVTGYAGQAGKKTREMLQQARGGVLFIDEAYQMDPARGGPYMTEAVDELVRCLTTDEFKGKVLVILAGYRDEMAAMMKTNPGLDSRFGERLHFSDLSAQDAAAMALFKLGQMRPSLPVAQCAKDRAGALAEELAGIAMFSNGRDVDQWVERTVQQVARRTSRNGADAWAAEVTAEDMRQALDVMVAGRSPVVVEQQDTLPGASPAGARTTGQQQQQQLQERANQPPRPAMPAVTAVKVEVVDEELAVEEGSPKDGGTSSLFGGVHSSVVQKLQDVLDQEGLQSEEDMRQLAGMDPSSPEFQRFLQIFVDELDLSPDEATEQLLKWQLAQKNLQEELKKVKQQRKLGTLVQEPIWRCAVCGRADKPWIACWVAPYIVGYRPVRQQ